MAEFCKECYDKYFKKYHNEGDQIITSEDDDLCEGCCEFKPVVIQVKKK